MEIDIKNYIEFCIPELKGCVYPLYTTDIKNISIVYTVTPISGGHLKQSQLELKVIGNVFDECLSLCARLEDIFDQEEDASYKAFGNIRFRSALAGGGWMFHDEMQMYEHAKIFIIDWRIIKK